MNEQWQKPKLVESASRDVCLTDAQPRFSLTETLDDGTVVGWHSHEFAQVLSPSEGVLALLVRNWLSIVPATHAAWVPAGVLHTVIANTDAALRTVCVKSNEAVLHDDGTIQPTIRRAEQNPALINGGKELSLDQLLMVFQSRAGEMGDPLAGRLNQFLAGVPIPRDRRARPIAFRLINTLDDQRTLKEWGEQFGASERTLTRIFQSEVGMSFRAWRIRLQVAETIALLLSGHSVKSASCAAGYANPSAFVAAFRMATGESPLQYLRNAPWE